MNNATELYGPNGDAVAELIERCKTITPEQATQLQEAWDAARAAARAAARYAAFDATWAAARYAAWAATWAAAWNSAWNSAWDAAGYAAGDAAVALVARELITPEQFNALYGPWASVMEVEDE